MTKHATTSPSWQAYFSKTFNISCSVCDVTKRKEPLLQGRRDQGQRILNRFDTTDLHQVADVLSQGDCTVSHTPAQNFLQVVVVPAGGESFVFDADFRCLFVFQQAQGVSAEQAEVGVCMPFSDSALVFSESDIQLPVQTVFDRPVTADGFRKLLCRQLSTQNVITTFDGFFAIQRRCPLCVQVRACGFWSALVGA